MKIKKKGIALTPPMGWNSWDCYGASVTEAEVRGNAEYMAALLKPYGWEWFETAYFGAPCIEDRSKEFERSLQMSKEQALELSKKSYDCIIQVLEVMKAMGQIIYIAKMRKGHLVWE